MSFPSCVEEREKKKKGEEKTKKELFFLSSRLTVFGQEVFSCVGEGKKK